MAKTDIAALLALGSAMCVAIGDVLQQRAAHRIAERLPRRARMFADLLGDQRWRVGLLLLAASIGLQAAALDHGSVLLVQALLMLSLLFALPINARLSDRTVRGDEWMWASLLTAAVIVVVVVGNPQAGRTTATLRTWAMVAAVFGPILIACVIAGRVWGGTLAAVMFALVSGSLWGLFAVLTKEIVARFGGGVWAVATAPEFYAWLLAAAGGLLGGQAAFRAGPLTASMPALEMSQPVVAAVLGVVVLGETLNTSRGGLVAMEVALPVMAAAVLRLAHVGAVATGRQARRRLRAAH